MAIENIAMFMASCSDQNRRCSCPGRLLLGSQRLAFYFRNMLSSLLRLVWTARICSLTFSDWLPA
eukprot:539432-Pyramimonas_sp.AAC.1